MDKKLLSQQLDFSIDNKIVSMDRSDGHRLKIVTQFLRFVTSTVHAVGLTGNKFELVMCPRVLTVIFLIC